MSENEAEEMNLDTNIAAVDRDRLRSKKICSALTRLRSEPLLSDLKS